MCRSGAGFGPVEPRVQRTTPAICAIERRPEPASVDETPNWYKSGDGRERAGDQASGCQGWSRRRRAGRRGVGHRGSRAAVSTGRHADRHAKRDRTAGGFYDDGDVAVGVALVRLGEGSRTLVVNLAACGAIRNAVDVSEDASRVLLSARTTGGSDAFCSDGVTVFLTQELGQRTVVDGHSGQPVSVEGR